MVNAAYSQGITESQAFELYHRKGIITLATDEFKIECY